MDPFNGCTHDCACSTKVYRDRISALSDRLKFVRGIHGLGPVQVRAVVAILLYYMVALNDEIRSCLKIRNDGVRMVKREIAVKSVRPNIWRMSNGSLLRFVRLIHFV